MHIHAFPVPLVPFLCYVSHCPYSVLTVLTKTPVGTDLYINSPPHCRGIHLSNNQKFNPSSRAFCVRILFRLALPLSFSASSLPVCTVIATANPTCCLLLKPPLSLPWHWHDPCFGHIQCFVTQCIYTSGSLRLVQSYPNRERVNA